jgi:hypothetical protein
MRRFILLTFALASFACNDEVLNPAPVAGEPSSTTQAPPPPPPKKPIKRTVETRNPYGATPGNLLVDGDFEQSISFEGSGEQLPWYAITNNALSYLRGETGGMCKSGTHCALLEPGQLLLGRGTSAADTGMIASIWFKPPPGRGCDIATTEIIHCNASGVSATLELVSDAPGADGWCEQRGSVAKQSQAVCVFVTSRLAEGEIALVDRAALVPDDGTVPLSDMSPMPSARARRLAELTEMLRRRAPFGDAPARTPPLGLR